MGCVNRLGLGAWCLAVLYLGFVLGFDWSQSHLRYFLPLGLGMMLLPALILFPENDRRAVPLALTFYIPFVIYFWLRSTTQAAVSLSVTLPLALLSLASVPLFTFQSVRKALPWLIAAGTCGLLIASLSGSGGGPDPMRNWYMSHLNLTFDQAYELTHYTRKTIHFCCYGLIALFAAKGSLRSGAELRFGLLFGLLWALPHAIFDEWRQSFEVSRTGSIWDVALDFSGMLVMLMILGWRTKLRENQEPS